MAYYNGLIFDFAKRQKFTIPQSYMDCLIQNVTNPLSYEKLLKTCKYFFGQKRVLVVDEVQVFTNVFYFTSLNLMVKLSFLASKKYKIWITDSCYCGYYDSLNLFKYLYKFDGCKLHFLSLKITYDEFKFVVSSPKLDSICWIDGYIKYSDGTIVSGLTILKSFNNLKIVDL